MAKLGADGSYQWAKSFASPAATGTSIITGKSVAVNPTDPNAIFVTGTFTDDISLGGDTLTSEGDADVFLARFDGQGNHVWSRGFGSDLNETPTSISVDATSRVAIAGTHESSIDFGGGALIPAGAGSHFVSGFVAAFGGDGAHAWSRGLGDTTPLPITFARAPVAAFDPGGRLIVSGRVSGAVDFGAGAITAESQSLYMNRYDPSGALLWSKLFGTIASTESFGLAIHGSSGDAAIASSVDDKTKVDFGKGDLVSSPFSAPFVAKIQH
ncbi:Hypothetical protein A7982_06125 [Minicystis rosea]|nr:Hypothetical protein A7982_06125 [Minicystis rosea]